MALNEADLGTMANIGAQQTSTDTYATVKRALESADAPYQGKDFDVFLQGSYGNDTNIFRESDVDVVIRLNSTFTYDDSALSPVAQQLRAAAYGWATYSQADFRRDVLQVLANRFGDDATPCTKAVTIGARGNRRKADVIIALEHRRYTSFGGLLGEMYVKGISFAKSDGTLVMNYPTQHRGNLIAKNQRTNEWFKHIIRIFKNARERMLREGRIQAGVAPSYYIECLLYNVPDNCFGTSYVDSMVNAINWLLASNRHAFTCANEQYPLFDGNPDVTWTTHNGDEFLHGLVSLWNDS